MRLLEKYGLTDYLESFRIRGVFPSKSVWNRMVKQRIRKYETVQWQNRISDADFSLFSRLHTVHEPHIFWYRSKENPYISRCYKSMMQMIAYLSNNLSGPFTSSYCKSQYVNLVQHCIHECRYIEAERIMMVTNIQLFDAAVYFFICRLDKTSQTLFLLGENNVQISEYLGAEISRFYDLCAVCLHRMWSKIYNRLI